MQYDLNSNIEIHKFLPVIVVVFLAFLYLNSNIEIHKLNLNFVLLMPIINLNSNIEIHK